MNILIINHYAGSDVMGMEYRPYYLGREWAKLGHGVTILTASYSHLRIHNPHIKDNFVWRKTDGIDYLYVKTSSYSQNGWTRVRNVFQFLSKSYFHLGKIKKQRIPHVIIASSTYPFDIMLAKKIARSTGAKVIFELHDIWPLSLIELHGYDKNHPMMRLIGGFERYALEESDCVVSLLPNIEEYFSEEEIRVKKCVVIPNGIICPVEPPLKLADKHISLLQQLREEGKFIVMYCGGFSQANYLDYFIDSAKLVSEDVVLVTVGDGPKKKQLEQYAKEMEISNLIFLDAVEKKQLYAVMEQADCLYIGAKKSPLYKYGISMNKIYDYMLAGKPVICGIDSPNNPLQLADCAVFVDSGDSVQLAEAISHIKTMSLKECHDMGYRGMKYVQKNHNYNVLAQNYMTALEEIVYEKTQ